MKPLLAILAFGQCSCAQLRKDVAWFLKNHEVSVIAAYEHGESRTSVELKSRPSGKRVVPSK